jgi:hypothetical protein
MKLKALILAIIVSGTFVGDIYAQEKMNDKLMSFLMEQEKDIELKDSVYLYQKEILNKQHLPYGIYSFGINGSHSNVYFYLKEKNQVTIVPSLKLEEIIDRVTDFFLKHPEIPFKDKVAYYHSVISLIEQSVEAPPWNIEK